MSQIITHQMNEETEKECVSLNMADLLERMDGDRELAEELLGVFLNDVPKQLDMLRQAVERADGDSIGRCAHRLKGAGSSVSAEAMQLLAQEVEAAAGDPVQTRPLLDKLEEELDRIKSCLSGFNL